MAGFETHALYRRLSSNYFVERVALAWRISRLDIAEHMYSRVDLSPEHLDPASAENIAERFYEIGRDRLGVKAFETASKWLSRAYDALSTQHLSRLSAEAGELRVCILQCAGMSL